LDFGERTVTHDDVARRAERERRFRAELLAGVRRHQHCADSDSADHAAPLFDEFLVVGVVPGSGTVTQPPRLGVLWRWPSESSSESESSSSPSPISNVELFCFAGVSERQATREIGRNESVRKGEPSLLELLYSRGVAHESGRSFAFRVNGGRYGVCVTRWEPPNWPILRDWTAVEPHTMEQHLDSCTKGGSSPTMDTCLATQRCYCMITRRPFFALQFGVIRDILDHDRFGLVSHTCSGPVAAKSSDFLFAASPAFTQECLYSAAALLRRYHSIPVPKPGSHLTLLVSPHLAHRRVFERSRIDSDDEEAELLSLYGGAQLAKRVPPWLLVPLLSAILLELQVVVVCANLRELTGTVLALLALLRPFSYHGVVLPIVPTKLAAVLDAPVPFIVGVTRRPSLAPFERSLVVADLDRGELVCQQKFPLVPRAKRLEAALCGPMASILREIDPIPGTSAAATASESGLLTPDQAKHFKQIATCVRDHLSSICPAAALQRSLSTFFTDKDKPTADAKTADAPVTVLVKEVFLNAVSADDRTFLAPFAETQVFNIHFANQLRLMDESMARQQDLCSAFDELR
jgi:hypothetical protein